MKQLALIPAIVALAFGASTHAETKKPDTIEQFLNLLEELTDESHGFLEGLITEMGPALSDLQDSIKDWSNYHPPEVLPNGDIIIRRKPAPAPALPEGTKEI